MTSAIRIGDTERHAAVDQLGEHYLAGRLSKEEYDERASAAFQARTEADLQPLFRDLPRAAPVVAKVVSRPRSRRRRWPVTKLAAVFVLLLVFTPLHLPWWGWLLFLWAWFSGFLATIAGAGRRYKRGS